MEWYHYLSAFWAGVFFVNTVPHFVSGVSGNRFPSPFAKPPGKGLSSPTLNVVWALINLVIGYCLFRTAKISSENNLALLIFFSGIALMSLWISKYFAAKEKE